MITIYDPRFQRASFVRSVIRGSTAECHISGNDRPTFSTQQVAPRGQHMAAMARNPSGMMVELTASRSAHGDEVYPSRTRSTSCTSRKPSRRSLEEGRSAEPEPASGRASKLWLHTARVVDICYCGYRDPDGPAWKGRGGFLWTSPDPDHSTVIREGKGVKR